jgi:hypothetical protein
MNTHNTFLRRALALLALFAAAVTVLPASAQAFDRGGRGWHGGGWGWGWGLGVGLGVDALLGWPGYYAPYAAYPYPYPYAYPQPVYVPATPAVAVVQPAPAAPAPAPVAAAQAQSYYYCNSPKGYYPYVRSCQHAWQMVPMTPPAPRPVTTR